MAGDGASTGGPSRLAVRCACGWEWSGDVESVVAATQEHDRTAHDVESTPEQVLAMARPADGAGDVMEGKPPIDG